MVLLFLWLGDFFISIFSVTLAWGSNSDFYSMLWLFGRVDESVVL